MPGFIMNPENGTYGPSPTKETARSYRWKVSLTPPKTEGMEAQQFEFYCVECDRPSYEQNKTIMHNGAVQIHLPTKIKWNPISMKFYNTSETLYLFKKWRESLFNGKYTSSSMGSQIKGTGTIELLDGSDTAMWKYKLHGIFPEKVTPSNLNYADNTISTTQLTLSVDWVEEETG